MKKKFKLVCSSWNSVHVTFQLYDPVGANCASVCILDRDVRQFIASWRGEVDWNGIEPKKDVTSREVDS